MFFSAHDSYSPSSAKGRRLRMDLRGSATPGMVEGSGGEAVFLRTSADEVSHIVTGRTSGVDALTGSAFCANAYYISK